MGLTNDQLLAVLEERLSSQKETLDSILIEAKKTNGRIQQLENWKSESKGQWRALVVLGTVIGFIIGAVVEFFKR